MHRTSTGATVARRLPKVLRAVAVSAFVAGTITVSVLNTLTIRQQQDVISQLVDIAAADAEFDMRQDIMLWDLHRRVLALEAEDDRIMAHVRWFVMRRSGTDELRKMELAVAKLENAD